MEVITREIAQRPGVGQDDLLQWLSAPNHCLLWFRSHQKVPWF
jgi:hypothetical protein